MLFVDRLDIAPVRVEKLRVGAGITALAAPSGAGKTRFFLALADLVPNQSSIRFDDMARDSVPAPVWRRAVRYVSAEPAWWEATARAHLPDSGKPTAMAERLGLDRSLLDKPIAELSTGERLRFGLVRALASDPPVVLLDEPTAALDEASPRLVEAELRRLAGQGKSIFLISHSEDQIGRIADRVLTIEDGIVLERV
ncbi:MAG TPA: ATP-binding cassette domain-containing protein [Devosiaceae bacterium]|nr:ATP-binding cassette domain-containing protein [Devosiaceae bacterium]